MKRLFFSICVLWFCLVQFSFSQEDEMMVTRLGRGQPFNIVNDIAQDQAGFLWLATEQGLYRYDGYTFVQAGTLFGDSASLTSSLQQIVIDSSGRIWFNADGVYQIDLQKKTLRRCTIENDSNILHGKFKIHPDRSGTVWIRSKTLYRYDTQLERFVRYNLTLVDPELRKGFVESSTEKNIFWIASRNNRVYRLEQRTGTTTEYTIPQVTANSTANQIHTMFQDSQGNLWIGGEFHAYRLDKESQRFIEVVPGKPFTSFAEDSGRQLFLGSFDKLL
ncbi:MAG: hypothetical protein HYZ34_00945 [Ignavibacteriae bacterium]|nr:hypothetical protein [Ignavibacteriota bacterium]